MPRIGGSRLHGAILWVLVPLLTATLPQFARCSTLATSAKTLFEINVSAGPLQHALNELADTTQLLLLYEPSILEGQLAAGVKGRMSAAQAMTVMLAKSDLAFEFTSTNTVALYRKHRKQAIKEKGAPAAAVVNAVPQHTVTVSADRPGLLSQARYNLSATKTVGNLLTVPISFESLEAEDLRDQQAHRLEDVLPTVSSVESAPDGQSAFGFALRGFPTYQYYLDGVRVSPDLHHDGYRELSNIERIDVVKGPASTLYGRMEPGGLVNLVTKQPLATPYAAIDQSVGGFNYERTQVDLGGPLNSDATVQYRLNAAHESGGSFRELLGNHRIFIAPVVRWVYSPQGEVSTYLEYLQSTDAADFGLPVIDSSAPAVPIGRRVEDGGDIRTTDLRFGVRAQQSLSADWGLRFHLEGRWLRSPQSPQLELADDGLSSQTCSVANCPVDQLLFSVPVSKGHTYYGAVDLIGSGTLLGLRHSVLTGIEYFDVNDAETLLFDEQDTFGTDLYHPKHWVVPKAWQSQPDFVFADTSAERWYGVYVQDQISLGHGWSLTLGSRYDRVSERLDTAFGPPLVDSGGDSRQDRALKSRAGLLYEVARGWAVYANYIENFGISTGIYGNGEGGTGTLLPAESAREWEVGVKVSLLNGNVTGSAAWYNLTETNIPQDALEPLLSTQGFRTVTGAVRNRGLEMDLQGQVNAALQWKASYAYTDSRIVRDAGVQVDSLGNSFPTDGATGNRLYGVARHGGSLWMTYKFPPPDWNGLKVGLGVIARTARAGDNANDYELPGFSTWRMLAAYGWRMGDARLSVQLNADNVFGMKSYESVSGTHTIMPNPPRRWIASLHAEF
jgi:iron complex outermembrane receptor protein